MTVRTEGGKVQSRTRAKEEELIGEWAKTTCRATSSTRYVMARADARHSSWLSNADVDLVMPQPVEASIINK